MQRAVVKAILSCQALVWSSGCASRSEVEGATASKPQPFPVSFESSRIDLGLVEGRSKVKFQLGLQNTSDSAAEVLSLSPGCGCTVLAGSPDAIPAKSTIQVEGELDVPRGVGPFSKPVTATIRIGNETRSLSASLIAKIAPSPGLRASPDSIELGRIDSGRPLNRSFIVSRFDETPLGLLDVTSTSELIRGEVVPLNDNESAALGWRAAKVLVTAAAGLPAGPLAERLTVSAGEGQSLEVFVRAEVSACVPGVVPRVFVKSLSDRETAVITLFESTSESPESIELRKLSKPLVRLDASSPAGTGNVQLTAIGECEGNAVITGEIVVTSRDATTSIVPLVVIRRP